MLKVGETHLVAGPDKSSWNVFDSRRVWLDRVSVVLVKRRIMLNRRKVYVIRTEPAASSAPGAFQEAPLKRESALLSTYYRASGVVSGASKPGSR